MGDEFFRAIYDCDYLYCWGDSTQAIIVMGLRLFLDREKVLPEWSHEQSAVGWSLRGGPLDEMHLRRLGGGRALTFSGFLFWDSL